MRISFISNSKQFYPKSLIFIFILKIPLLIGIIK
nr:MAG TPA: hypothetical protein [Bacteriophage sp.]